MTYACERHLGGLDAETRRAEVAYLARHLVAGDEHVVGLEVAMDDLDRCLVVQVVHAERYVVRPVEQQAEAVLFVQVVVTNERLKRSVFGIL